MSWRVAGRVWPAALSAGLWLLLLTAACNDRFEFDVEPATSGAAGAGGSVIGVAGGGVAGVSVGGTSAGAAGSGAAGGGSGGSGGASACGAGPPCPAGLRCVTGECHECAEDADCSTPGLGRCDALRHRCVECVDKADCASDFACDELANRCLRICSEQLKCPATAHGCDEARGVCYECDGDHECSDSPLGPFCAADGSGCVTCKSDEDCSGQRCDQLRGKCVDCRDGRDCTSRLCDPESHACLP